MKKIWEHHAHHFLRNVRIVKHKLVHQWHVYGNNGTTGPAVVKLVVEVLSYEVVRSMFMKKMEEQLAPELHQNVRTVKRNCVPSLIVLGLRGQR